MASKGLGALPRISRGRPGPWLGQGGRWGAAAAEGGRHLNPLEDTLYAAHVDHGHQRGQLGRRRRDGRLEPTAPRAARPPAW